MTAHFIHAFKEEAMQRFFRGCVVLDGWADIPEPSPDDDINAPGKGSIVFLDKVHGSMADSLRHHICFIVSVNAALNSVALRQNLQNIYSSKEQARTMLRADVIQQGEFNMVAAWEGIGKTAIRLHRQCSIVGKVFIIVGEYAGVEYLSLIHI